jgi:hypothetical protein
LCTASWHLTRKFKPANGSTTTYPLPIVTALDTVRLIGYPRKKRRRAGDSRKCRPRPGTEGSNPSPSSGESSANLIIGAGLLSLGGDNAALGERADELVAITTEQGFPALHAQGTVYRGYAKVKNSDVVKGISLLRSVLSAYRATGTETWIPHHIALMAWACEIAGQIEEAVTLLADALQIVERTGERWLATELYRHKGQLLLRQGHFEAAEESPPEAPADRWPPRCPLRGGHFFITLSLP